MDSSKIQVQIKAKGQQSNILVQENQKKVQIKQKVQHKPQQTLKKELLMKLYVYGSCESDQFRHPSKQSQSKRPICLTNIQKFDLNEEDQEQSQNKGQANIIINPLFKKSVYKIACGGLHSVVLTADGKAYTFGCNDQGALGRKGPECIPLQVILDSPVDLVSAGDNHTMFANSTNGIVYFTGNYNYLRGQKMVQNVNEPIKFTMASIDIRNKNLVIQKLVSGANHTCILINNKIYCRGEPQSFTTGRRINERRKTENSLTFDGVGLNNVVDVWCGGYHTVAKVKKGKDFVYHTWGKNDQGQLGIGSFKSQAFPVQIKNLRGKNITKVAAGTFFTLFLTENGEILGCGTNQYGQLGLGEDYEFTPSNPESEIQYQDEEKDINQHVENLNLQQQSKRIQDKKNADELQGKKMEIECENKNEGQVLKDGVASQKSQMISESNQKVVCQIPNEDKISITIENGNANNLSGQKVGIQVSQKKKYIQKNTYIKSARHLEFLQETVPKSQINNISAGSQFSFAWNNQTELYSWGFGMNYVLLNGEENEEYQPFKVRNKIINDQIIENIQAGGQHVLYIAYQKTESKTKPNVSLQQRVTALLVGQKNRLSRKRKS